MAGEMNPMGRIGQPDDMVGVCLFLASGASSYINGAQILADGGSVQGVVAARGRLSARPRRLGGDALLGGGPRADRAAGEVVAARRAVLAAEVDDLQVQRVPGASGKTALEVALGPLDAAAVGEPPAGRQAVDVGVDREGRARRRPGPSPRSRSCGRPRGAPRAPRSRPAPRRRARATRMSRQRLRLRAFVGRQPDVADHGVDRRPSDSSAIVSGVSAPRRRGPG